MIGEKTCNPEYVGLDVWIDNHQHVAQKQEKKSMFFNAKVGTMNSAIKSQPFKVETSFTGTFKRKKNLGKLYL